ncbi:MAG: hypothetical protein KJ749_09910, partial [Planctomycetes bacterium]|nr:hypothetical protein [Planctomycetota bacterium]
VHRFSQDVITICDRALLHVGGAGRQLAVAALDRPRQDGTNVIAFNAKGDEIWSQSVSNHDLVQRWPDCGGSLYWACRRLGVGNLDGEPGDELAVAANDAADYPTRISVINPRDGAVISTFWHMGQFTSLWILPDFLGPGRAAILARGSNNKLDGFDKPLPGDAEPYTGCEVVDVIVVLDPRKMDGLGPPRIDRSRVPIGPIAPYAYAFLEQPQSVASATQSRDGQTETVPPIVPGPLTIREITPSAAVSAGREPFLRVSIGRKGASEDGGWIFTLDRNLQLRHVAPVDGEPVCPNDDYWRTRWRPIIQNGEYVDE